MKSAAAKPFQCTARLVRGLTVVGKSAKSARQVSRAFGMELTLQHAMTQLGRDDVREGTWCVSTGSREAHTERLL